MKPENTKCNVRKLETKEKELSPALIQMAAQELEEFKIKSDESFFNRVEMNQKLISL